MRITWDIFCNVIDNYGDIGIAWRLARQLAAEHDLAVRLWVNDLGAFHRLWPGIAPDVETQHNQGVEVRAWREPFPQVPPAQVVIEAFGCSLPVSYLTAMSTQSPPPVWVNLEYLSAEPWVKAHHGLPSPHPQLPLTKHFFFPGYEQGTGGVLVERDLAGRRDRFQHEEIASFWKRLGLDTPQPSRLAPSKMAGASSELRISLFSYENPALAGMLDAWALGSRPILCLIPEDKALTQVAAWLNEPALAAGALRQRGNLTLRILPFMSQDDYDRLLWACDINFVRGEDSCVRAQWAARPLVWQAYPQAENAHRDKLEALLLRYVEGLEAGGAEALAAVWRGWNGMDVNADMSQLWTELLEHKAALDRHAHSWCDRLVAAGSLAAKLVDFVERRINLG
jgi:uncharacterized repeat protein (TIGR03837 family)